MKKIVIIGNGIGGITAARHIRKLSDHEITVISSESDHFYSRTALMYIYMGHMKYEHTKPYEDWFWDKNKITLARDYVEAVDANAKSLSLKSGTYIKYDILIIASGSKSNKLGWPGQNLKGVQGLYSLQDLEEMEANTNNIKRAVIVGGGLIGIEMAEMLLTRKIPVTFLIREKNFWDNVLPQEEAKMVSRHLTTHGVDLREETELKEIISDGKGGVKAVMTKDGEEISCQFVGLTVGVSPNIGFLENSGISTGRGVTVNGYFESNVPDVYAIGDCTEFAEPPKGRKSLEQVWYTARMHGETVAQTICGNRTVYRPGPWFNSAKFMDIEYQVYGEINAMPKENEASIYWEHEEGTKSVRIVYNKENKKVMGFNLMGIRYKHAVCDRWLASETNIKTVMENLKEANFDPEFHKKCEEDVITQYNRMEPGNKAILKRRKKILGIF